MKLENEQDQVVEVTEQAEGVTHMRVDEEDPVVPEQAELPVEEEQEEVLDLFGNPIEPVKPVKLPPAKKPASTSGKSSLTASNMKDTKPKEEKKYGPEFQYAYAGHVGNLPEEDMTLERVREYLQIDFPELSKERTRMEVDEDKNLIIPIVKGTKSG